MSLGLDGTTRPPAPTALPLPTLACPPPELALDDATTFSGGGATATERWVVTVNQDRHILVGRTALYLLRQASEGAPVDQIADGLRDASGDAWSPGRVLLAYETVLERVQAAIARPRTTRRGMWCVLPLLPEAVVQRVSRVFVACFARRAWPATLTVIVAGLIAAALRGLSHPGPITPATFALGYVLFVALIVLHELGHAAATTRAGARPRRIGFALYLVWPSLWTDVTDSWRLRSRDRLVIDIGGVYLQMLATAALAAAYAVTGSTLLAVTVLLSISSAVLTLNPFFRFDGYWLLCDALGEPDLSRAAWAALARLRPGRQRATPINRRTAILATYAVATIVVWGFFLIWLSIQVPHQIGQYPHLVHAVHRAWSVPGRRLVVATLETAIEIIALGRLGFQCAVRLRRPGIDALHRLRGRVMA